MPRGLLWSCILWGCYFHLAAAESGVLQPYEALVRPHEGQETYARSGPGKKYYPTTRLAAGQKVTVRRHDPGGWHMIDPPPGSFSWIIAKYVQRTGEKTGTVTENRVITRVGSFQSDNVRDFEQVRLNTGDSVEIIEEKLLPSDKGPERWLKIAPPRGEYRWVRGEDLVPATSGGTPAPSTISAADTVAQANPQPSSEKDTGPAVARNFSDEELAEDSPSGTDEAEANDPFIGSRTAKTDAPAATSATGPQDLSAVDSELQAILQKQPAQWDLKIIREDYEALLESTDNSILARVIQQRLKKLEHYEAIHADAAAVARLAQETEARDRQLQQLSGKTVSNLLPGNPTATKPLTPGAPPVSATPPAVRPKASRFDGAGILRRVKNAPPGIPPYALVAPDGRLLSYVVPSPGMNLEPYLGQSLGLNGPRAFDPKLGADLLKVQQYARVQLIR